MQRTAKFIVLLLVGIIVVFCTNHEQDKERPNVLFLMIDTLRADALGCYGNEEGTSPFIDSLSQQGTLFRNVISASTHTKVSIATLFTGLIPPSHGVRAVNRREESWGRSYLYLPKQTKTLAEGFTERGYQTFAVSTNPYIQPRFGFGQGFSRFDYIVGEDPVEATAEKVHIAAMQRFSQLEDERPYFAYLHYMDVHYPYQPPFSYYKKFTAGLTKHRPYYPNSPYKGSEPMTREKAHFSYMVYLAQVRYLDDRLREFLSLLQDKGLLENTVIVIAGDHGEEFYEHGGFGHNYTVYEEVIHVPLIIIQPGENNDREDEELAGLIDLYPTLARLAGIDVENTPLQGKGLFRKPALSGERAVYSESFRIKIPRSVRTAKDKLIYNHAAKSYEYYKLEGKAKEQNNLYQKDNTRIKRLTRKLRRLESRKAMFPPPAERPSPEADEKDFHRALQSLGYLDNQ